MMTTAIKAVVSAPGLQHHSRSILAWPAELDATASALLRELIVTGSRVLSLGDPLPASIAQLVPEPVPLSVWRGKPGMPHTPAAVDVPHPPEWHDLVRLWLDSGITPLTEHMARDSPEWRHARQGTPPVSSASAQRLTASYPGTSAVWLACCIATRRAFRGKRLAASCVASVIPEGESAVAFVEPLANSGGFFHQMGWSECGNTYLYQHV